MRALSSAFNWVPRKGPPSLIMSTTEGSCFFSSTNRPIWLKVAPICIAYEGGQQFCISVSVVLLGDVFFWNWKSFGKIMMLRQCSRWTVFLSSLHPDGFRLSLTYQPMLPANILLHRFAIRDSMPWTHPTSNGPNNNKSQWTVALPP